MKISVVIPMYNAIASIEASINSCLRQSLMPHEIIVVDDASTDDSYAFVQKRFGTRTKLIKLAKNQGPSAARNAGWEVAEGDYIAFLDSDDCFQKDKLKICQSILEKQKDIDLLWHHYSHNNFNEIDLSKMPQTKATRLKNLLVKNKVSSSAIVYKRSLPMRFDEQTRYCEDYDIALRTAYKYNVQELALCLTQIGRPVLAPGGASQHILNMRLGEMRAYTRLSKLHPIFYLAIPFLWLWSGIKYLKVLVMQPN